MRVEQVVPCGATPAEQAEASSEFGAAFDPARFDALIVDALARIVVAPHLDVWRSVRPVVALVHELPGVANPTTADRERTFEEPLFRSDRLVAVSGHGKEVLLSNGVPAGRVAVVRPGFDGLQPCPGGARVGGTTRVLCVAQWIPRKGVLDLVRAWSAEERPGAVLDLVGDTDADPGYVAKVLEAASQDPSVIVRGPVSDAELAGLYASADLFALPSPYQGHGNVYPRATRATASSTPRPSPSGCPSSPAPSGRSPRSSARRPPCSSRRGTRTRSPGRWAGSSPAPTSGRRCPPPRSGGPRAFRVGGIP